MTTEGSRRAASLDDGSTVEMTVADTIRQYNNNAYKNWDQNVLSACPHCNRTFLPERLEFHLKACRADNPFKKKRTDEESSEEKKIPRLGLAAREAKAAKDAAKEAAAKGKKRKRKALTPLRGKETPINQLKDKVKSPTTQNDILSDGFNSSGVRIEKPVLITNEIKVKEKVKQK